MNCQMNLGNIRKISHLGGDIALRPVYLQDIKLTAVVKNAPK